MFKATDLAPLGRLLPLLSLLFTASLLLAAHPSAAANCQPTVQVVRSTGKSWESFATAAATLDRKQGWRDIPSGPSVCAADLVRDFTVTSNGNTLPYYVTSHTQPDAVKRAVIVFAGKNRDSWSYFNLMRNSRNKAAATFPGQVTMSEVAIYSPMIFIQADKDAGAVAASDVYWKGDGWASGQGAEGPSDDATHLSTFDALDQLVKHIASNHPGVKEIVLAGHSMGAQLINRYSTLKKSTPGLPYRVSYWIGNPGSWLWMETKRPIAGAKECAGYDKYKYGLSGSIPEYAKDDYYAKGGRAGVLKRLLKEKVHVLVGEKDYGPGDVRCQAKLQGGNHRERGTNYQSSIAALNGGRLPPSWTFDVVTGCTHNDWCMFSKNVSMKYLFIGGGGGKNQHKRQEEGEEEHVVAQPHDEAAAHGFVRDKRDAIHRRHPTHRHS
ncbi:hypothetical protein ACQY0O_001894 [Thecaphora frezii]